MKGITTEILNQIERRQNKTNKQNDNNVKENEQK
jgi:hypothetical protein